MVMPIYEYECSQCAHRIEVLQKISDSPLRDCPECDMPSLRKLVSAASFRLKGTGWYETDFKNKDKPKSTEKEDSATKKNGKENNKGSRDESKKDASTPESKPKEAKKSEPA
uniref:Putative regulatory protein, FmdB family n=1 Tax=Candidatus Kentrum sp. TC TaxID=2126339 RepID=A0A450YLW4_9GAMM|nr:MAG: putative regulatory protein, FmdB family [Candidatus Kentron sp. TC]VFK56930.1 MAG: putative regulatory protein, FmdB family [Candidatus Kentron sp. TC]